jgi:HPt (histidine-containing phosphotransfer) domain-containing protein
VSELETNALDDLRELGGDDFLAEMIDTFLADSPPLLAALHESLERGDADELRRAAHTLKSNGRTFGAGGFSDLCRELEERAKSGELGGAGALVDRIDREYEAVAEALRSVRPGPAA